MVDVKFCEGWPLVGSLLAVFKINLQNADGKIFILVMEMTYFEF